MRRAAVPLLAFTLAACAANMGGPSDVPLSTVALRAHPGATPAAAAAALREVGARVALVAGPADPAWFTAVAEGADLHLSGPAASGDVGMALMAMEPLGDTVLDLRYEGGSVQLVDALYDLGDDHYLDLMAFHAGPGTDLQALSTRMLRYIATDVPPSAAIVLVVAVPSRAAGDSIADLLEPGYFDSLRCGNGGDGAGVGGEIRLIYGPEARIWCGDATHSTVAAGARIHAELVAGLRR